MPTDSSVSLKNTREKRNNLAEVSEAEKQLWARIQSKGVLDKAVKHLYYMACCIYEKLFLSENELPNLQTIEYLLWRLHYKHIDEFRRRISQSSSKEESKLSPNQKRAASMRNMVDEHMEGFKLFLSEAVKFYQDLIRKIKRYYGLVDEPGSIRMKEFPVMLNKQNCVNANLYVIVSVSALGTLRDILNCMKNPTMNKETGLLLQIAT